MYRERKHPVYQYGHVKMRFEPSGDLETAYAFDQEVVGGTHAVEQRLSVFGVVHHFQRQILMHDLLQGLRYLINIAFIHRIVALVCIGLQAI